MPHKVSHLYLPRQGQPLPYTYKQHGHCVRLPLSAHAPEDVPDDSNHHCPRPDPSQFHVLCQNSTAFCHAHLQKMPPTSDSGLRP